MKTRVKPRTSSFTLIDLMNLFFTVRFFLSHSFSFPSIDKVEIYMKETASLNNIFLFEASPMCSLCVQVGK